MFASASPVPRGVTLFTSLPPRIKRTAAGRELGAVYQRECIASWRRQGFDVVSLNARVEIDTLLQLGYEVTFKEVASTRPRINDFRAVIKEEPAVVAGIINWDYWFPIAYQSAGGQLFTAPAPMLMHLDHPQGWSLESWYARGRKMHDSLARNRKSESSFPFVKYDQTNELSNSEVEDFATAAFKWLKTAPRVIQMEDPSAWLWCSVLAGIDSAPKQARDAERRFEETKRGFEESERRLKNSLSWRVTRPLRSIEEKISQVRLPTRLSSFLKRVPCLKFVSNRSVHGDSLMISYAQNFEDVMIARLFDAGYRGFYVDIGAAHPDYLSITRHFYDQGWSGINVEPTFRFYPLLCGARPRDINLQCAVGNSPGRATFYEIPKIAENSTLERTVADRLAAAELAATPHEVEVVRLSDLCALHVKDRTIDFMKIDVEGGELGVLQSGDWEKFRPRLLIVEATVVNSKEENWQTWEPILIEANYHKVWFDGLNNFYLREEDLELRHAFRLPPNIFDGFEIAELASLKGGVQDAESGRAALRQQIDRMTDVVRDSESGRAALRQQIEALFSRRGFRWLIRFANWPELKKLVELLGKS